MTNNYVIIRKTEFDASRVNSDDSDQTTALRSRWLRNADQEFYGLQIFCFVLADGQLTVKALISLQHLDLDGCVCWSELLLFTHILLVFPCDPGGCAV